jgi:MFS family permease
MKELVRNKNFLTLMIVQTLEQIGDSLVLMALIAWVMAMPGDSSANMTILLFWIGVPILLIGPFTGVFIDRVKRKNLLIASTFMKGSFIFAIYWFISNPGLIPLIYGLVFMKSFSTQFFIPAKSSYVPSVVSNEEKLITANSLFATGMVITQIFTYAVAGKLIGSIGVKSVLMISASMYIPATLMILFINAVENIKEKEVVISVSKVFQDLVDGFKHLLDNDKIAFVVRRVFIAMIGVFIFYIALTGKFIEIILEDSGLVMKSIEALGYMQATLGFGLVAGILLLEKVLKKTDEMFLIRAIFPLMGIMIAVFYFYHSFIYLLVFGFFGGMAGVILLSIAETVVQKNTPENMRGRIFASYYVFRNTGSIIAAGITGVLIRFMHEKEIVLIAGLLFIVYGVINYIAKVGKGHSRNVS